MKLLKSIFAILAFSLISFTVSAQDDIPDYDPGVPIDGGISILAIGRAIWGIKKLKDKK